MQLKFKHTMLKIDALMLLFPLLAMLLGNGRMVLVLMAALAVHELAHWGMARALCVRMESIRLTPFGGLSRMENPYAVSAARLGAVAAAGPLGNLLAILVSAALCRWGILGAALTVALIQVNAMLMLLNLLPALPLDGGRMLYALLSGFIPKERALAIGIWTGRALAGILVAIAAWGCIVQGQLNLSFLFVAVFILASAQDERFALLEGRVKTLLRGLRPVKGIVPAHIVAMDEQTPFEIALRAAQADRVTLYAVYREGKLMRIMDDRELLGRIAQEG
jgi:stage IV sporulation protein FB